MVLLGRKNMVRFGRFVLNFARLDLDNDMAHNGELMVQDIVLSHIPQDRTVVVFDVGANLGKWSFNLMQRALDRGQRNIHIHLFEPSLETYQRLKERVESFPCNDRMHIVGEGISDEPGMADFFVLGAEDGVHSLYSQFLTKQTVGRQEIILNTIDRYCEQQRIASVFFIKIDIEGNDHKALMGARQLLEVQGVQVLQFEYNHRWISPHCLLYDSFELLESCGYQLGKITPKGIEFYPAWDPELETYQEGNYLACLRLWVDRFPNIAWWNS
jgi:FkbM family methyltransferase